VEQGKSRNRIVTWEDPQAGLVASRQLSGLEYLQKLPRDADAGLRASSRKAVKRSGGPCSTVCRARREQNE
jgi:hypothetical protein